MAEAYVLVNCDLGAEEEIISGLKQIEQVMEVHGTFGAYDIIAKVQAESADQLREAITWKIRKMNKIRSTLTLTVVEGQGWQLPYNIKYYNIVLYMPMADKAND